jgi:glycosyltransferase involved in cell wall biosynthesis
MPTFNHAAFVPNAISYFLRQSMADAELIVVDDGSHPVQDLIPPDPRIRYIRLPERRPIGAKRNLACELARADIIAHWDDDDWYSPDRLHRQAAALDGTEANLCGLNTVFFYDTRAHEAWRYVYPANQRPWLAGNSLMYRRAFWANHRFHEIMSARTAGSCGRRIRASCGRSPTRASMSASSTRETPAISAARARGGTRIRRTTSASCWAMTGRAVARRGRPRPRRSQSPPSAMQVPTHEARRRSATSMPA